MAKKEKKQLPKALSLSAAELVSLLIDEAGETRTSIAQRTGIDLSAVSRFLSSQRQANEKDYRSLAEMAISLKIAE
jgi:predicted transcriptional regulator